MNSTILEEAGRWAQNPVFDSDFRAEIQALIDAGDETELTERFYKDLEFGTGGLRAILGAGKNRINIYTVRRASQALTNTVLKTATGPEKRIAISYDSRRMSKELAREAACVFAANGITAFLYARLNPVALLSYSVRHHHANAGIMVTASHNPPAYNGYKVFWSDGAQVTPPHDQMIIDEYNSLTDFSTHKTMAFNEALERGLIQMVGEDVENAYFKAIYDWAINPKMCAENGDKLKIVYTPIHGTGLIPCTRALADLGLKNVSVVKEQAEPDGNFPTVNSPNPENPEALALAVELMKKENADIAFGSDPDTDRLGVALPHKGEIHYINGNQIGILMLHYILENLKEQGRMPSNPYFVKTIVTTALQEKIAASYGVETHNTLTGFKWICGRMNEIEKKAPEKNFVFATEESFGYLNHDNVRDKDGVSSVTLMSEMTLWYKLKGMNLIDALDAIYEKYGFSHETLLNLVYEGKSGSEKIGRIMEYFRSSFGPGKNTSFSSAEIAQIEDYKTSKRLDITSGESSKIELPASNVIGLFFKNGDRLFLRPSGTEPKIKFYIMINENEGDLATKKSRASAKTDKILSEIKSTVENL